MQFERGKEVLGLVDLSIIQLKPDAPWINRQEFGVQFTEEVMEIDSYVTTASNTQQLKPGPGS